MKIRKDYQGPNSKTIDTKKYSKLRKGMVFWYNPSPEVDKFDVPDLMVDGKPYKDCILYGKRPYVVVSSDIICIKSQLVQVVPMHTDPKTEYPSQVRLTFKGKEAAILCEQIRTINQVELTEYECILDDEVIEAIDKKLQRILGIEVPEPKEVNESEKILNAASMKDIENIINSIVEMRVKDASKKLANTVEVDDAVERIGLGLVSLLDEYLPSGVKAYSLSGNAKSLNSENKSFDTKKTRGGARVKADPFGTTHDMTMEPIRVPGNRHKWEHNEVVEFLHDWSVYDQESMQHKYGCASKDALVKLKYALGNKLET